MHSSDITCCIEWIPDRKKFIANILVQEHEDKINPYVNEDFGFISWRV